MRALTRGALASLFALSLAASAVAQDKPPLKLGLILDMSGPYADITGPGSVTAGKMAAAIVYGGAVVRPIEAV